MKPDVALSPLMASALKTLDAEIAGLADLRATLLADDLGTAFEKAVECFAATKGRIIVTGIGKSGHVARKIAATFCSTGTSAIFLHPSEASHGDLGAIGGDDVVFALTLSGGTSELSDIITYCGINHMPLVVATANPNAWAAVAADICLTLPEVREACPNELAPTTSTTLQMVLGDALAVALIEARGFSPREFRLFHPGGKLGAQLSTLEQIMGTGDAIPRVAIDAPLRIATIEMSRKRYGCTAVVDELGRLVGAFTDGDLRRCISSHNLDDGVGLYMSPRPVSAEPDMLSADALALMNQNAVSVLFVTQEDKLLGIVHMHDLVRLGIG